MAGSEGINLRSKEMRHQVVMVRKVVSRLVNSTVFEKEGWRRILGVTAFLSAFDINPKNIKLSCHEVFHPMHVPARSETTKTFMVSNFTVKHK